MMWQHDHFLHFAIEYRMWNLFILVFLLVKMANFQIFNSIVFFKVFYKGPLWHILCYYVNCLFFIAVDYWVKPAYGISDPGRGGVQTLWPHLISPPAAPAPSQCQGPQRRALSAPLQSHPGMAGQCHPHTEQGKPSGRESHIQSTGDALLSIMELEWGISVIFSVIRYNLFPKYILGGRHYSNTCTTTGSAGLIKVLFVPVPPEQKSHQT